MKDISITRVMDHYEIRVDGEFYTTCDSGELTEILEEINEEE